MNRDESAEAWDESAASGGLSSHCRHLRVQGTHQVGLAVYPFADVSLAGAPDRREAICTYRQESIDQWATQDSNL